jgi:hypothetical protein
MHHSKVLKMRSPSQTQRYLVKALAGVLVFSIGLIGQVANGSSLSELCSSADLHAQEQFSWASSKRAVRAVNFWTKDQLEAANRNPEATTDVFQLIAVKGKLRRTDEIERAEFLLQCLEQPQVERSFVCEERIGEVVSSIDSELRAFRLHLAASLNPGPFASRMNSNGVIEVDVATTVPSPSEFRFFGRGHFEELGSEEIDLFRMLVREVITEPVGLESWQQLPQQIASSSDETRRQFQSRRQALEAFARDQYQAAIVRQPYLAFYNSRRSNNEQALKVAVEKRLQKIQRDAQSKIKIQKLFNFPTSLFVEALTERGLKDCGATEAFSDEIDRRERRVQRLWLAADIGVCGVALLTGAWPACAAIAVAHAGRNSVVSISNYQQSVAWALMPSQMDPSDRQSIDRLRRLKGQAYVDVALVAPSIVLGGATRIPIQALGRTSFGQTSRGLFIRPRSGSGMGPFGQVLSGAYPLLQRPMRGLFLVGATESFWPATLAASSVTWIQLYPTFYNQVYRLRVPYILSDPDHAFHPYLIQLEEAEFNLNGEMAKEILPVLALIHGDPIYSDLKSDILNGVVSVVQAKDELDRVEEGVEDLANAVVARGLYAKLYSTFSYKAIFEERALLGDAYSQVYRGIANWLETCLGESVVTQAMQTSGGSQYQRITLLPEAVNVPYIAMGLPTFRVLLQSNPGFMMSFGISEEDWISLGEEARARIEQLAFEAMTFLVFQNQVMRPYVGRYYAGGDGAKSFDSSFRVAAIFMQTFGFEAIYHQETEAFLSHLSSSYRVNYRIGDFEPFEGVEWKELPPAESYDSAVREFFFDMNVIKINEVLVGELGHTGWYVPRDFDQSHVTISALPAFTLKRNHDVFSRRLILPTGEVVGLYDSLKRQVRSMLGL